MSKHSRTILSFANEPVISSTHDPIIRTILVADDLPIILPTGCVLGKDGDGKIVPYTESEAVDLGTGDGSETDFAGELSAPVEPGTVEVVAGAVTLTDDGHGNIAGTGGSGSVNYATGAVEVSFAVAPVNLLDVTATSWHKIAGVLIGESDLTEVDSVNVLVHGTVVKENISRIDEAATPPEVSSTTTLSAADLGRLEAIGIWPE